MVACSGKSASHRVAPSFVVCCSFFRPNRLQRGLRDEGIGPLTEVEVVVLGVADDEEEAEGVDDGCTVTVRLRCFFSPAQHHILMLDAGEGGGIQRTLGRGVLAGEVLSSVTTENAGGLGLGSRATGELLVEVDDALHADGVGVRTKGL